MHGCGPKGSLPDAHLGGHRFEFPASVCSTPDKKDNKVKEWEAKSNKATQAMAAGVES